MIKGEQYYIESTLTFDGKEIDFENVKKIVFAFDDLKKTFIPNDEKSEVIYENGIYKIPLTQEETLKFNEKVHIQTAVKYKDGDVLKTILDDKYIYDTIIKEVI